MGGEEPDRAGDRGHGAASAPGPPVPDAKTSAGPAVGTTTGWTRTRRNRTRKRYLRPIMLGWTVGLSAWAAGLRSADEVKEPRDIVKYPVSHIVEEEGGIDRMATTEVPTEEYYQALRADMQKRHGQACPYVLDHLLSLEAFLMCPYVVALLSE